MLRNDENTKEYLEDIEPYHGDPVGYLKYFSVKRDLLSDTEEIKELYYKVWSNLRESKTEVLRYFLNWDEKSAGKNGRPKDDTRSLWKLEKVGVFSVLRFHMTSSWTAGVRSTSSCSLAGIIDS
ncbi:CHS_3a_G0030690.mRNA.1.CDS.1 [Saccharomyces cerevisiae]|nr:CHS_3a_G0030690.mRNA.1.CDS.1 [Saccharomyces cerevisiae]CAI7367739.1 CHS_3a_G0030690.mRNA.1.CDS.1 [Saccharomyces cerevisiae]